MPADRLGTPTRRFSNGIVHLNARMERMINFLIEGAQDDPSHEPLGLCQAAKMADSARNRELSIVLEPIHLHPRSDLAAAFDSLCVDADAAIPEL
jgi:hypothetical protein